MPDFSSTHSTTAFSGGLWYRPTTSTTFSANSGSEDSLKVSLKCGLMSNLRQIRPIVDSDRPLRLAIEARDQCVASCGVSSRVATITSSTLSSRIDGGRPGRGSSASPSSRRPVNRRRHRATVDSDTRRCPATSLLFRPSAQARTILARSASAWEVFARRAHRDSWSRSASVSTSPAFGLPGRAPSASPPSPCSANRARHFRTVSAESPRSAATTELPAPGSAHASTIRARPASRGDPDSSKRSSPARSSSVSTKGAAGSDMTSRTTYLQSKFQAQHTSAYTELVAISCTATRSDSAAPSVTCTHGSPSECTSKMHNVCNVAAVRGIRACGQVVRPACGWGGSASLLSCEPV
jgi:hypothetical protein